MNIIETSLSGVTIIEPDVFGDARGYFMETWHKDKFSSMGIDFNFVQDNQSYSAKNTLRGLHYQIKNTQGKLVRVVSGEIFDVAVDIRRTSPCFGKWTGQLLSSDNKKMLWVPPGFAHGLLVVSETAEVLYKCTDFYAPEHERSLAWNDKNVEIDWPLDEGVLPTLSEKDRQGKTLNEIEKFT
jgi:dTDP-4-dehydrorhamnose 3,5-epimerase